MDRVVNKWRSKSRAIKADHTPSASGNLVGFHSHGLTWGRSRAEVRSGDSDHLVRHRSNIGEYNRGAVKFQRGAARPVKNSDLKVMGSRHSADVGTRFEGDPAVLVTDRLDTRDSKITRHVYPQPSQT